MKNLPPKIEKGVPLPPMISGKIKYPFKALHVGESFVLPITEMQRVQSAAARYKYRHPGWSYVTRTKDGIIRCWRLT